MRLKYAPPWPHTLVGILEFLPKYRIPSKNLEFLAKSRIPKVKIPPNPQKSLGILEFLAKLYSDINLFFPSKHISVNIFKI